MIKKSCVLETEKKNLFGLCETKTFKSRNINKKTLIMKKISMEK